MAFFWLEVLTRSIPHLGSLRRPVDLGILGILSIHHDEFEDENEAPQR